jgi:prepilin-type N-terminal cleavage/methylation domain-containing protein
MPVTRVPGDRGFTLIELLIVISIVGLLVAVFLPDLLGAKEQANVTATDANLTRLSTAVETYTRKHGSFPPDDLNDPDLEGKPQWKPDNGLNTGIESLVVFLSQSRADGADLGDLPLTNTDKDDHGVVLPLLNRKERVEVADAWGTPLAYFSKTSRTQGFGKAQTIVFGETGDQAPASPRRNAEGLLLGNGNFQLLSAGVDRVFGTDDDRSWPAK